MAVLSTRRRPAAVTRTVGRVAGANVAGADLEFPGAIGTSVVESLGIEGPTDRLSDRLIRERARDLGLPE